MLLNQVLDQVHDGIAVVQDGGKVLVLNPAGRRLLGLPYADTTAGRANRHRSQPSPEIGGPRVVDEWLPYLRVLRGERIEQEEVEIRDPDAPVRHVRLDGELLRGTGADDLDRVLITYHDVTEDHLRQEALAQFAGHVAHDLRNPLTVIDAWTEMLRDTLGEDGAIFPETGGAAIDKISTASRRMRDFISALLDYTTARDRDLRREAVDLVEVAADVVRARAEVTDGAQAPVIRIVGCGWALADPQLVRMVIDNLVANSCKYVAPGVQPRVLISVEEAFGHVEVAVSDNGLGIPHSERERVFEAFERIGDGRVEGSGLGLGICQRIVERHGGRITIEDAQIGTTISFTLRQAVKPSIQHDLVSYGNR